MLCWGCCQEVLYFIYVDVSIGSKQRMFANTTKLLRSKPQLRVFVVLLIVIARSCKR